MENLKKLASKFSLIAIISLFATSSAFAGTPVIVFGPVTNVPTLSGSMLIVLSLLLMVVAVRVTRNKHKNTGKFFITLIGASALLAGAGGVKLISEVNASVAPSITMPQGESLPIFLSSLNEYLNNSGVTQQVKSIGIASCDNFPNGSGVINECRVGLVLGVSKQCVIDCGTLGVGRPAQ